MLIKKFFNISLGHFLNKYLESELVPFVIGVFIKIAFGRSKCSCSNLQSRRNPGNTLLQNMCHHVIGLLYACERRSFPSARSPDQARESSPRLRSFPSTPRSTCLARSKSNLFPSIQAPNGESLTKKALCVYDQ